ncbi:MAG: alpha/beta hydrolase [Bdellovibrionota bacterium]
MRELFVQNQGVEVHVLLNEVYGSNAILYVPGMFGTAEHCLSEFDALPNVPSIALSIRGRGKSTKITESLDIHEQASDIIAVMDAVTDYDNFIVCGHSFGNLLSVLAAERRPSQVKGLILIDKGLYQSKIQQSWLNYVMSNPPKTSTIEIAHCIFRKSVDTNLWQIFQDLAIPTLVVKGEKPDSHLSEDDWNRFNDFSFAEGLRLKNSGHFPEGEDYNLFISRIRDFRSNLLA